VRQALTRKGSREDRKRDHWYYFLHVSGRKSAIYTKISHNESQIGANLLSLMARQLRIGTTQFELLIDCKLGEAEYIRLLKSAGELPSA
jgi:hypothetical protein